MIGHGGGDAAIMLKPNLLGTNFVQTSRFLKFTMACIRDLVMIEYQAINRLIFKTKTYVVGAYHQLSANDFFHVID